MSISYKFRSLRKAIASIASVAVFTLAVAVAPQASAQTFDDVSPDHWAYDYVEQLVTDGVIDANDTYRPDDSLNRAELVKIAVEATTGIQTDLVPATPTFSDVPATMWYFQYVETAAALGIVEGYKDASGNMTGLFGPGDTVNRAAATKILVNAYGVPTDTDPAGIFDDVDADAWFYDYVTTAYNQSIIDGYKDADGELTGMFGPGDPVTRAQVAKLSVKATDPAEREVAAEEEEEEEEEEGETGEMADGDLEISLSADSMESATIPQSANVAVASFDLTAGADDIKVTSLMFERGGVGTKLNLGQAVLKDGEGNRVSKAKSINSDDEITFTILNGGITIEAGETLTVSITLATGTATGNHNFALVSADSVNSNAQDVVADFPVRSNTFEVGTAPAGSLTMANDGSPANVKVGETDVTIAKFKLENGNVEDVAVTSITLKETGTADEADALDNIKLLADGEEVATGTLNDKYIAFVFDTPLDILKNKNTKFKVTADIIGEAAKTLIVDLDSTVDIEGTGENFGFGIGVTKTFTTNTVNIEAGAITLSKTEPNDKIRKDKKDVVLSTVNVTVNSGDGVEMKAFNATITVTGNNIATFLENIELHDVKTGSVYDLTAATATGVLTTSYYDQDIGIALEAGESREFEVRADTKNVGVTGNTIVVSFANIGNGTPTNGIEFQETADDTYVTDVVPSSLSYKTITGEASTVAMSVITQSAGKNAVIGTEGVEVLEFIVEPGSASAINLSEVVVTGTRVDNGTGGAATVDNTRVNKATLYQKDGDTLTELDAQSGSQFSAGAVTFDSLDIDVEASGTARFLVTVDVVDDSEQATDTLNFGVTSLTIDDDDSDTISTLTLDGVSKTATAITGATSARTVTIVGVGTLAIAADTTDSATDKAKLVLGNTTSDYVASFELTATNEPILVKDLNVVGSGAAAVTSSAFKAAVSDVILYDEDDNEIGRESVTSTTVTFENIDYVVSEGSENIYVKVKAAKMGKDAAGQILEGIQLYMQATDADGDSSNKSIALPAASTKALAFSTIPTRISGAEFVSTCGSKSVTTKLTNGSNDVAILKITTDASSNTKTSDGSALTTLLSNLRFTVESDAMGSTSTGNLITNTANAASVTVEKINGTGDYTAALTSMTAGLALVNTGSLLSTNLEIDNSTSVCFLIKADLAEMSSSSQGYVQVKMNTLDSTVGTANIEYLSDDSAGIESGNTARAALLLDDSTIESTKVSSAY